jgi:hypothetical protein
VLHASDLQAFDYSSVCTKQQSGGNECLDLHLWKSGGYRAGGLLIFSSIRNKPRAWKEFGFYLGFLGFLMSAPLGNLLSIDEAQLARVGNDLGPKMRVWVLPPRILAKNNQSLQLLGYITNHSSPVARFFLPEKARGRIPGGVSALKKPAPLAGMS